MLTTVAATEAIARSMPNLDAEAVPLDQAVGRVLRQTVRSERDQPPFDRVTMDGIAVSFDSFDGGNRSFAIEGTQHAGDPVQTLTGADGCIEIMTGGVLPRGTDCVIPVERVTVIDGVAAVESGYETSRNQFVHPQGSDHLRDCDILQPGAPISPMDIAIIASCGLDRVLVSRQPIVRVVSTGNELVPPGLAIEPHQIRLSNGPALVAMLAQHGFVDSEHAHLIDEPGVLEVRIAGLLRECNVLILSGGVSMGKADFVPQVLEKLGVKMVFHKISQRPGKPMWFGIGPDKQAVFALPGNPVSTLVCCRHYVLPALWLASGRQQTPQETATLAEDVLFDPDLTGFLPVRISVDDSGMIVAKPAPTNTSGDFAALSGTDGYVELEKERNEFKAGSAVPLHRWLMRY
jgi:molybdopterin molybdotransferase